MSGMRNRARTRVRTNANKNGRATHVVQNTDQNLRDLPWVDAHDGRELHPVSRKSDASWRGLLGLTIPVLRVSDGVPRFAWKRALATVWVLALV